MNASIIILIVLVILFSIFILYSIIYNKFQDYIIKINEVEGKIDEVLRSKFDSIIEMNNIIKEGIKTNKVIVDDISKIKNGIYYFRDRYAENYPEEAKTNINDRYAYNFTVAIFDLDTNKLHIYTVDT